MAGAWSGAMLLISIALFLSSHPAYCRPTFKPPSFFPSFNISNPTFSRNSFIPRVPKTASTELDQEKEASTQLLGIAGAIGGIIARYGPAIVNCISSFQNERSSMQADPQAIISELDRVWKRQLLHGGSGTIHQASAELQSLWPALRQCLGGAVGGIAPSGPGGAVGGFAPPGLAELQQLRQNWAIASGILDQFFSQ